MAARFFLVLGAFLVFAASLMTTVILLDPEEAATRAARNNHGVAAKSPTEPAVTNGDRIETTNLGEPLTDLPQ